MFFEKIQSVDSEKVAILADGKSITYGDILTISKSRAVFFENKRENFLLCHSSELENLIIFLPLLLLEAELFLVVKTSQRSRKTVFLLFITAQ